MGSRLVVQIALIARIGIEQVFNECREFVIQILVS